MTSPGHQESSKAGSKPRSLSYSLEFFPLCLPSWPCGLPPSIANLARAPAHTDPPPDLAESL